MLVAGVWFGGFIGVVEGFAVELLADGLLDNGPCDFGEIAVCFLVLLAHASIIASKEKTSNTRSTLYLIGRGVILGLSVAAKS